MFQYLILSLFLVVEGRINLGNSGVDLCIIAETSDGHKQYPSGLLDKYRFKDYTYQYCYLNPNEEIVTPLIQCSCLYDNTSTVFAYTEFSASDLATFLGSENICEKIPENTKWYPNYQPDKEYFIYAKKFKLCYIDRNLLGIGCDTSNEVDWVTIDTTADYSISDIPELTQNGFILFVETGQKAFFCERTSSEQQKQIFYFHAVTSAVSEDQVALTRGFSISWKIVSSVLQFVYKVLDIFYGDK
nr:VP7 [Bat RVJ-like rotavirus BtSY2]